MTAHPLLHETLGRKVVVREYVAAAAPRDVAQIRTIRDPEVLERNEEALVDGFPKPQLDRDTVIEPLRDVFAVEALWRCREAQEFFRRKMVQEPVVGGRRSVVELIDDDDVERVRSDPSETFSVERLNHREDVPTLRDMALAVNLTERPPAEHSSIGSERLTEDLGAVGHEEE